MLVTNFCQAHGVNAQNTHQSTLLHFYVAQLNLGSSFSKMIYKCVVKLLLEIHHASANVPDSYRKTSLCYAVEMDDVDLVKLLLAHGGDVTIPQGKNNESLEAIAKKNQNQAIKTLIQQKLQSQLVSSTTTASKATCNSQQTGSEVSPPVAVICTTGVFLVAVHIVAPNTRPTTGSSQPIPQVNFRETCIESLIDLPVENLEKMGFDQASLKQIYKVLNNKISYLIRKAPKDKQDIQKLNRISQQINVINLKKEALKVKKIFISKDGTSASQTVMYTIPVVQPKSPANTWVSTLLSELQISKLQISELQISELQRTWKCQGSPPKRLAANYEGQEREGITTLAPLPTGAIQVGYGHLKSPESLVQNGVLSESPNGIKKEVIVLASSHTTT